MKKAFSLLSALVITATAFAGCSSQKVNVMTLKSDDMKSTVTANGYIQSSQEKNVYTSLNYTIEELTVEVGDVVKKGDVLCRLDTHNLETQILAKKTALDSNVTNSGYTLSQGDKDYIKMSTELENGTYQPIVLAERAVDYAKESLEIAQKNYDNKVKDIESNSDTSLKTMKNSLSNLSSQIKIKDELFNDLMIEHGGVCREEYRNFLTARHIYNLDRTDANRKEYDDTIIEMNKMSVVTADIKKSWESIYADYYAEDNALIEYENLLSITDDTIDALKDALDNAQMLYDSSVTDLELAKRDSADALDKMKAALDNTKAITDFSAEQKVIADLEKDLEDCTITAVTSGTITAVYAKEGNTSGGVMFVIEDTENLEVLAKFKEYDIAGIEVGMSAVVKADATGSTEYEGVVTKIAPTAVKDSTSTDTEFEVDVAVSAKDTKLLIGMKAKAEVLLDENSNAFAVPYSAIRYDDDDAYIFVADGSGNTRTVKKIYVSTGMDNDTSIEIYGTDVKEGLCVITDSDERIAEGQKITPVTAE